jgi:hypothetical protein
MNFCILCMFLIYPGPPYCKWGPANLEQFVADSEIVKIEERNRPSIPIVSLVLSVIGYQYCPLVSDHLERRIM